MARLPIHYAAASFLSIGLVLFSVTFLCDVKTSMVGLLLVLILGLQLPILVILNIAAFERVYDALGIAIWWWVLACIFLVDVPVFLGLLALNKLRQ